MKSILALAAAALLPIGAAAAHDAAKCTELLTGSWKLTVDGSSLTIHLKAGGDITVETQEAGKAAESSSGTWSADGAAAADQCLLMTKETGATEGDKTVVVVKDDKTIELADMGVFTRQ